MVVLTWCKENDIGTRLLANPVNFELQIANQGCIIES